MPTTTVDRRSRIAVLSEAILAASNWSTSALGFVFLGWVGMESSR
jgi:hypothetical protein